MKCETLLIVRRSRLGSTLVPSPPAANVEMNKGKGKGGKGKQSTSWQREVGTYPYLKNFRKCLRFPLNRCLSEFAESPDSATCFLVYARSL